MTSAHNERMPRMTTSPGGRQLAAMIAGAHVARPLSLPR